MPNIERRSFLVLAMADLPLPLLGEPQSSGRAALVRAGEDGGASRGRGQFDRLQGVGPAAAWFGVRSSEFGKLKKERSVARAGELQIPRGALGMTREGRTNRHGVCGGWRD